MKIREKTRRKIHTSYIRRTIKKRREQLIEKHLNYPGQRFVITGVGDQAVKIVAMDGKPEYVKYTTLARGLEQGKKNSITFYQKLLNIGKNNDE